MTSTVDWHDPKTLIVSTEIRHPNRRIRIFVYGEIMRWFEFACRDPVDPRGLHIQSREVDDPCEFCRIEDLICWRECLADRLVVRISLFFDDEVIPLRISENIHTASEFLQNEVILDRIL